MKYVLFLYRDGEYQYLDRYTRFEDLIADRDTRNEFLGYNNQELFVGTAIGNEISTLPKERYDRWKARLKQMYKDAGLDQVRRFPGE